jgi:hypothetical protein
MAQLNKLNTNTIEGATEEYEIRQREPSSMCGWSGVDCHS